MAQTTVEVFDSVDALQSRAAEHVTTAALRPAAEGRDAHIALAGGSTPRRLHELLARDAGIDWSRVRLYWGDERTVPPDDPDSNYAMARATLLDRVAISEANVYRMRGEDDPDAAARAYEAELRRSFGVEPPAAPRFDLILLGAGPDGHTASLFPGTRALEERDRWVVANAVPQLHTTRITLTYPVLNNAALLIFLVVGADKAEAVERIFGCDAENPPPAAAAHATDGVTIWLFDRAAGARLPQALRGVP